MTKSSQRRGLSVEKYTHTLLLCSFREFLTRTLLVLVVTRVHPGVNVCMSALLH